MSQHFESQVDAYLDGEMDGDTAREMQNHLQGCTSCTRAVEDRKTLRAAIRSQVPHYTAPELFRSRLQAALREQRPRQSPKMAWWPALAAAAALVLIVGTTWQVANRHAVGEILQQELVSSHVRSLIPGHLIDVPSSDQHTVKPWFNGKIDFSPTVPDLSARGFALAGGRLDFVRDRTVAVVVYTRRQHVINLFLWPATTAEAEAATERRGFHLIHWTSRDMTHWAVSDLNPAELKEFVQIYRAEDER
jgi:anti-sigma factor RsiW